MQAVLLIFAAAPKSFFGDGQQCGALADLLHAHNLIPGLQAQGLHAPGGTSHSSGVLFMEPDGIAKFGSDNQLIVAGSLLDPSQLVPLVQVDCDQPTFADVAVRGGFGSLDDALFGHHHQMTIPFDLFLTDQGGDLLILAQRHQVHRVGASGGTGTLGNVISFETEHPALVGKEHNRIMRGADKHLLHKILLPAGHSGDAPAAAALGLVGFHILPFHISIVGQGDDTVLHRDQVLNVHLPAHRLDLGAALVLIFLPDHRQLVPDDTVNLSLVGQDLVEFPDPLQQLLKFLLDLDPFQTGQLSQTHGNNGLRLDFGQPKPLHQGAAPGRLVLGRPQNGDHLVDKVQGDLQAFQDMLPLFCFFQIVFCTAYDNLGLESDIILQHLFQGEDFRFPSHQRQLDDAEGFLKLAVLEQLVEHQLRVSGHLELDDKPHSVAVRLIPKVADSIDPLILDQLGNIFNHPGLVDPIGDLGDRDAVAAVFHLLDVGAGAHRDLTSAGGVGCADAGAAHNDAAGGEIRPLDLFHNLVQGSIGILHHQIHRLDHLPQIVGRDVGGHTHCNAGGTVDQKVRKTGGKHQRLFPVVVVVGSEIHRLLVDIGEHHSSDVAHSGLSITVSGRRVSVHRAKVSVPVHQGIAHGEILCQTHQRIVHRGVAMGMVPAQHRTDGIRRLSVRLVGGQAVFIHGI